MLAYRALGVCVALSIAALPRNAGAQANPYDPNALPTRDVPAPEPEIPLQVPSEPPPVAESPPPPPAPTPPAPAAAVAAAPTAAPAKSAADGCEPPASTAEAISHRELGGHYFPVALFVPPALTLSHFGIRAGIEYHSVPGF